MNLTLVWLEGFASLVCLVVPDDDDLWTCASVLESDSGGF